MKHINVATYNICHGRYADLDWSRIASAIREADADIVGLQEIDMGTNRVGGLDTVAALTAATGLRNRGMKVRTNLYVLRKTVMPAVLIELGFITNANDAYLMVNEPELFAEAIYQGTLNYLGLG